MKVKVAKWGNSLALRLPKAAAEAAGLTIGSEVDITVDGTQLRVRRPDRLKSSRQLLEEMVAEMKRLGPNAEPETIGWGSDRGSEILNDDNPH